MKLPFLDRQEETARFRKLLGQAEGSLGVLYGRRRCGKSRLLREILPPERAVYYVGDDREGGLQRESLATEIGRLLPGFEAVTYPDWNTLFARWWREARPGTVLALDEFPSMVAVAPELPSLLQKHLDHGSDSGIHLILSGSSQRMMQGLVLDRTAPLFGRAREILKISPLPAGWIEEALHLKSPEQAIEAYSIWGGTPRYWELAGDYPSLSEAIRSLVLSPMGVLHEEPSRLLLDDLRDTTQAASILSLIGQGCHRISEIAGRLGKPATALSRPLQRLQEMDLIHREQPFGEAERGGKRTLYKISDPFLRFWFRFVEIDRSRLGAGLLKAVAADIEKTLPHHIGEIWEELARTSVPHLTLGGKTWGPASRWWGTGLDRKPLEVDLLAYSSDDRSVLVGEVKWAIPRDAKRLLAELEEKARRLPEVRGREVAAVLWLKAGGKGMGAERLVGPRMVLDVLR
ncbi:MAG TPA: ATP-binding protein [Thermoanaerobaculia bacterium]|jgi:AAA+ ATPase superfamily predicted ATPase|nr:ATP-binding protein [Thermoanaerobaculia bacterium]